MGSEKVRKFCEVIRSGYVSQDLPKYFDLKVQNKKYFPKNYARISLDCHILEFVVFSLF